MPDEGPTEMSGMDVAESLVAKVGGLENLIRPADAAQDDATDTSTTEPAATEDAGTDEGTDSSDAGLPRDPETGKFVSTKKELVDEDEEPEGGEEQDAGETDDEQAEDEPVGDESILELDLSDPGVQAFLEKYDGDIGKALVGAAELAKMSGRQGNELGELRALQARLESLERGQPQQQQQSQLVDYTDAVARVSEHEFENENDRSQAFARVAQHAVDNGDYDSMAMVINEWKEFDPFGASNYRQDLIRSFEMAALREEQAASSSAPDPTEAVNAEVAKVIARHPDLEQHVDAIGKMAQERPYLGNALQNGTPQERASALEDLYVLVRSRDTDTSSEAMKRVRIKQAQESERAKADAAVVSASRGTAASADQPTRVDQFKQAFLERTGQVSDE